MKRIAISCNYYHKLPCIIHLYSLLCHGLPVLFCHGLPAWYIVLPWIALPCVILLYMLHCHELSVTLDCHELLCVSHLKSFPFGQHHHGSPPLPTGFFIADTICFSGLSDRFLANICVTHAYFILVYLFVLMFSLYLYLFHRTAWLISSKHLCSSLFASHLPESNKANDNHIRVVQILLSLRRVS